MSSPHKDWQIERDELVEMIRGAGHDPIMSEVIRDERPIPHVLREKIEQCDLFVCMLGKSLGTVPEGMNCSITESELTTAYALGLPVHILVRGTDAGREPRLQQLVASIQRYEKGQWYRPLLDSKEIAESLRAGQRSPVEIFAAADLPAHLAHAEDGALETGIRKELAVRLTQEIKQLLEEHEDDSGGIDDLIADYSERLRAYLDHEWKSRNKVIGAYIPVQFLTNRGLADSGRTVRSRKIYGIEQLSALIEATNGRPMVLKGEPGSGKTAVLSQIAGRFASDSSRSRIPLFVQLNRYSRNTPLDEPVHPIVLLRAEVERIWQFGSTPAPRGRLHRFHRAVRRWLSQGRILLLADALDELPASDTDRDKRWEMLKGLAHGIVAGGGRAVFTCRERDYPTTFGAYEVVVPALDDHAMRQFVFMGLGENFTDAKKHRLVVNLRSDNWNRIWLNPFSLCLLLNYLNAGGSIEALDHEASHGELFSAIVQPVLTNELERHQARAELRSFQVFAGRLAFLRLAGRTEAPNGNPREVTFRRWLRNTGMVDDENRFQHHRLAEYFAAYHLMVEGVTPMEAFPWPAESQHLREIIRIYAGMIEEPSMFLASLLRPIDKPLQQVPLPERRRYVKLLTLAADCASGRHRQAGNVLEPIREQLRAVLRTGNPIEKAEVLASMPSVFAGEEIAREGASIEAGDWLQEAVVTQLQGSRLSPVQFVMVAAARIGDIRSFQTLTRLLTRNLRFALLEIRAAVVVLVVLVRITFLMAAAGVRESLAFVAPYLATHPFVSFFFPDEINHAHAFVLCALLVLPFREVLTTVRKGHGGVATSLAASLAAVATVALFIRYFLGGNTPALPRVLNPSDLRYVRIASFPETQVFIYSAGLVVLASVASLARRYAGRRLGVEARGESVSVPNLAERIGLNWLRVMLPIVITAAVLGYAMGGVTLSLLFTLLGGGVLVYLVYRQTQSSAAALAKLEDEDPSSEGFAAHLLAFLRSDASPRLKSRAAALLRTIPNPAPALLDEIFQLVDRPSADEALRDLLAGHFLQIERNAARAASRVAV